MNARRSDSPSLLGAQDVSGSAGISAAVALIILALFLCFQPAKISHLNFARWLLVVGGLGLTSFLIMGVCQLLFTRVFCRKAAVPGPVLLSELAAATVSLLGLGIALFLYFHFQRFIGFHFAAFAKIQLRVFLVGFLPLMLFMHRRSYPVDRLRQHAHAGSAPPDLAKPGRQIIALRSNSGREVVHFNLDELVFVSSADNYVVFTLAQGDSVRTHLLRISLNEVERVLHSFAAFFRCHRTAIVNLRAVKSANGNAQGYRLRFDHIEKTVPVARSRVREFRERLRRISAKAV